MTITDIIFIDGNIDSGKGDCKYHCYPTCHPAQIGPKTVYGCRHDAWPQNRMHDFVPIVDCCGKKIKCELVNHKFILRYRGGLVRRKNNLCNKYDKVNEKISDINDLLRYKNK